MWEGLSLITCFSDFRYIDLFWSYFGSKFDSWQKSSRISDVFALPNFVGAPLTKLVPTLTRLLRGTSPEKVS